jgi:peptide/nickel transport system permease protein
MTKYIIRRLIQAVPTFFGITVLSFLLMVAAPGDPVTLLTFGPNITAQQREALKERAGVNDPWYEQYIHWLIGDDWKSRGVDDDGNTIYGNRKGILRGDFGNSLKPGGGPVTRIIKAKVLPTLELTASALIFGLIVGLPIGIYAAIRQGGVFDNATRVLAVIVSAVPIFWLGLILLLIFGSWLEILPLGGRCEPKLIGGCEPLYQRLNYLLLPMITLGALYVAGYSRYMRTSMLDVISQDYVRTARAKGLSARVVWFKHGARNALIPIATLLGPTVTGLLAGAVLTESIYSWPGLGREAVLAVNEQNYTLVMAIVMLGAVTTIAGYILSDILYAVIDPRIRFD